MKKFDLLIGGEWRESADRARGQIRSPFDGSAVGDIAVAGAADVELALSAAEHGAALWRRTPGHERAAILNRAAVLADERADELAAIISAENGKPLAEALGEARRSGAIIRLSAHEGTQLYGESLPLDANPGTGQDKVGFTLRQPVGIVVAITPFNYPALLVLHKVGPALASGNAVILKPASATPLTALALAQIFVDAGVPAGVLSVLTGSGGVLGDALVADPRVRKVSFTGSTGVGERISSLAGITKLSLELGASSPTLVLPGADLEQAAAAVAAGGYVNGGQVCISVQRVILHRDIEADFLAALQPKVEAIRMGDPFAAGTTLGPLISEREAERVATSITRAVSEGAQLLTGGERDGAFVSPAIVTGVDTRQAFAQEELFGPAVAVTTVADFDAAIAAANGTPYGLAAGVFGGTLAEGVRAMREIDAGSIHLGWTPLWRADLMPYGGFKASGYGKEGVRSTVAEMTEVKTVILHG
ncbi:glyceraldehyde-3-phosphate dehydrogenase (NADP+) [Leucobacter luti]|uniref:Glyceraldehyde-3-phosphate dehydrogenase (NADP+) n=1 Tax=Leucobacter luti TaxID=340320 RepID=A0A4R6S245_9MICO|nr:aldehyde dehydrogenase family protein [Leucobacter luti]MCW2289278.1 glyceraldehyde-3-phosphate dehydrogenase (NADP+) [Leucobacter luti]TCK39841.1 glyceraldehyde-3-phosphate dehydrogenase (NADP+) [Leucobacter luti]TDP93304.1 glyceraldehyde-3-phosphate dehydrogenase (NADP+) [Leucobacter luti]